jgi:hypothetical protein
MRCCLLVANVRVLALQQRKVLQSMPNDLEFGMVADLDQRSRDPQTLTWRSHLKKGERSPFRREPHLPAPQVACSSMGVTSLSVLRTRLSYPATWQRTTGLSLLWSADLSNSCSQVDGAERIDLVGWEISHCMRLHGPCVQNPPSARRRVPAIRARGRRW